MKYSFLITLVGILLLSSCKKEGCTDQFATNYSVNAQTDNGSCDYPSFLDFALNPYLPKFQGTYGLLMAIKTKSSSTIAGAGNVNFDINTAVASFSENSGENFISAGTLLLNDVNIPIQEDNSYLLVPSQEQTTNLNLNNEVHWTANGKVWPEFSLTSSADFPVVGEVTSNTPIVGQEYILTTNGVANADSIMFDLIGSNNQIKKVLAGDVISCTFTVEEVNSLGGGAVVVQISGLKYESAVVEERLYYIVNQSASNKVMMMD